MGQEETPGYMEGIIDDATPEKVAEWISAENIASRDKREFAGFKLTLSLDGGISPNREVTLVRVDEPGKYPQHIHHHSDAYFIVTKGSAVLLSGKDQRTVGVGERIMVPRGMPHGFEMISGQELEFVSIQSPPIINKETGEGDLEELPDFV